MYRRVVSIVGRSIMSIELPEIEILSKQMNKVLPSKKVKSVIIDNYDKLRKISFFNKDITIYDKLVGTSIEAVSGRGTVVRSKMSKKMNLLLAPEMGGEVRFHANQETIPKKLHFKADFTDGTVLTVRLKGYGLIFASIDSQLKDVYSYKRDVLEGVSPLDDNYTLDHVIKALDEKDKNLKTLMVGKEAIVVGYGNAGFQEIAYKAGIHPKRKSSTFSKAEKRALFNAIKKVTEARLKKGGKTSFTDLYGTAGKHVPFMGGHLRDKECPKCGTIIERLMFGGGPTYLCPTCQT